MTEQRYNGFTLDEIGQIFNLPALLVAVPELVTRIRELETERADLTALEAFLLHDGSAALVLSNDVGKIAWELSMDELSVINEAADLPAALRDIRGAMERLGEVTE